MKTLRIIISPAKKMRVNTDVFDCHGLPQFLLETEQLLQRLRAMSYEELKTLWKCESIVETGKESNKSEGGKNVKE